MRSEANGVVVVALFFNTSTTMNGVQTQVPHQAFALSQNKHKRKQISSSRCSEF
eukprot:m.122034 g.122034  ORF g.122034 m.122034 type:complete len:54 (-) comp15540_c1_seq1:863-1024(-)